VSATNIEVHFFRGDPAKGHDTWMYSIRGDDRGYRRGKNGGSTLLLAALKAACDIEGATEFYYTLLDAALKLYKRAG
jgi:hypothetical protein